MAVKSPIAALVKVSKSKPSFAPASRAPESTIALAILALVSLVNAPVCSSSVWVSAATCSFASAVLVAKFVIKPAAPPIAAPQGPPTAKPVAAAPRTPSRSPKPSEALFASGAIDIKPTPANPAAPRISIIFLYVASVAIPSSIMFAFMVVVATLNFIIANMPKVTAVVNAATRSVVSLTPPGNSLNPSTNAATISKVSFNTGKPDSPTSIIASRTLFQATRIWKVAVSTRSP